MNPDTTNKQLLDSPETLVAIGEMGRAVALAAALEDALREALAWDQSTFDEVSDEEGGGDGKFMRRNLRFVLDALVMTGLVDHATWRVQAAAERVRVSIEIEQE